MTSLLKSLLPLLVTLAVAGPASAHVTLDRTSAPAGSSYRAVLRVNHGCGEGSATTGIAVRVPAGIRGARPMVKPGWALAVNRTAEATEFRWTAATREAALPDAYYDEFVLVGRLPDAAGPLWFKVLQSCESGRSSDWADVPAEGTSTQGLRFPALLLEVAPAEQAGHQHTH